MRFSAGLEDIVKGQFGCIPGKIIRVSVFGKGGGVVREGYLHDGLAGVFCAGY